MNMHKIISGILSASLFVSTIIPTAFAGFSDVEDSKAIDVVSGIGIMEGNSDATFSPEANLTRAEFAQIVADIYNYGAEDDVVAQWKEDYFSDVFKTETDLIPPEVMNQGASTLYSDVQEGGEYFEAIKLVTRVKAMNGVGNGEFNPDGNLTVEQALKVILTMLGYAYQAESQGGYPNGFIAVAENTDMLDNVKSGHSSYATRDDIANILYNALEIPLMQYRYSNGEWSYVSYETDTFLSKILNLGYNKGRMTGNGYTNLKGEDPQAENIITVNNGTYRISEDSEYVREYIGRDVEVYYSLAEDDNSLVYARLSGKDSVVEFDISDFYGYSGNHLTYLVGENDKEKNIDMVLAPYMIYNNAAVASFDNTIFGFNHGTVTVITPAQQSNADLIILKSYQNFNIDLADTANNKIYSSSSILGGEIDLADEEREIVVYDFEGNEVSTAMLANGTVTSVCYGDKRIEIYISNTVKDKFTVKSLDIIDGEYIISDGKDKLTISKDYIAMNPGVLPRLNAIYNLKIDFLGNVVSIKEASGETMVAFLNSIKQFEDEKTFKEVIQLKYFDFNEKVVNRAYIADKVKIVLTDDTIVTYSMKDKINDVNTLLTNKISALIEGQNKIVGSIIRYTKNEDGEINWIELPGVMENSLDDSSRLVEIKRYTGDNSGTWGSDGMYGGTSIITTSTAVLQCNYESASFGETAGYKVTDRSILTETSEEYDLKVYSLVKNSPVADYVIYTKDPTTVITTARPQTCALVTNIHLGLNQDNEAVTYITTHGGEYVALDGVLDAGNVTNMQGDTYYTDANGTRHNFTVERGDMIRFGQDTEGNINKVQLVYDANADYSTGVQISGNTYTGFSRKGNLAGIIDGWSSAGAVTNKYTNPFSILDTDGTPTYTVNSYKWSGYNDNMRVMVGSVVRTGSNYVVTTTRNLNENPGTVDISGDGTYPTNIWPISACRVVTISKKGAVTFTSEPVASLKGYESTGTACDRVFITSRLGKPYNFIVYRYEE